MKRMLIFLMFIFFCITGVYAGPFGLEMGMSLEDIKENCDNHQAEYAENDIYVITPIKKHPTFNKYLVWVDPDFGLYHIRAIQTNIKTNDSGTEAKAAFYNFEARLEKIYGKPDIVDGMINNYTIFDEDYYWLYALQNGLRQLSAVWDPFIPDVNLKENLMTIALWVDYWDYKSTALFLDYYFTNSSDVENTEDDVL